MVGTKKIVFAMLMLFATSAVFSQVTQGKIIFERKTNLKKRFKDNPRFSKMINDDNKIRREGFELVFNDTSSAFIPIEEEDAPSGMMSYMTSQNTIYQNLQSNTYLAIIDLYGSEALLGDSIPQREWKITNSKRNLGGYKCTKAIWEQNDSTRVYAWFSPDIVPSVGPEGFSGLPGAILGLATEDGGIIYFAKEVIIEAVKIELLTYVKGKKDVYTKSALIELLVERMGKWTKRENIVAMFGWY